MEIVKLDCRYSNSGSTTLWPNQRQCQIVCAEFSNRNLKFEFTGPENENLETKILSFDRCKIEFIPLIIFQQFPNLKGLSISKSNIPALTNDLFADQKFQNLQYLDLSRNFIDKVDDSAFSNLKNVKWISLWGNKFDSFKYEYFKHNKKLQYIRLNNNQIKQLHPKLFQDLEELKVVEIEIDSKTIVIGSESTLINFNELNEKLKPLFDNYKITEYERIGPELKEMKEILGKFQQNHEKIEAEVKELEKFFKEDSANMKLKIVELKRENAELKKKLAGSANETHRKRSHYEMDINEEDSDSS